MKETLQITSKTLSVLYTNYKGETSWRVVTPSMFQLGSATVIGTDLGVTFFPSFRFGTTLQYPEPTWLLDVYDHGKNAKRTFAVTNIRMILPYSKFPILGPMPGTEEQPECPPDTLEPDQTVTGPAPKVEQPPQLEPRKAPIILSVYRKPGSPNWSFTQEQVEVAEARINRELNPRDTLFLLKEMGGTIVYKYLYTHDTSEMLELQGIGNDDAPWYLLKADELYENGREGLERIISN